MSVEAEKAYAMVLDDDADDMAMTGYRKLKEAVRDRRRTVDELEAKLAAMGVTSPVEHLKRVDEVRALMNADDVDDRYQARSKVKLALNDMIETMTFGEKGSVLVMLVDRARIFTLNRAGKVGSDLDMRTMFADELNSDGRFGPVTVRTGGVTTVENELTPEQEAGLAGYIRRVA